MQRHIKAGEVLQPKRHEAPKDALKKEDRRKDNLPVAAARLGRARGIRVVPVRVVRAAIMVVVWRVDSRHGRAKCGAVVGVAATAVPVPTVVVVGRG